MTDASSDVTQLLIDWSDGDEEALSRLMPVVYQELRRRASRCLRSERPDHTLQTTALVHEAFLRLVDQRRVDWRSRGHFFAIAAQMMRRILVDHARRLTYAKRGGGAPKLPLDEAISVSAARAPELVALDDCLDTLRKVDPQLCTLVELRYFGGLNNQELAAALELSIPTVSRRWRAAKAWIYSQLTVENHP